MNSQLNEADAIPVCFVLFQPMHAFGELNLFLLSISENTQGMHKACVTVNGLQMVEFHSRICAISKKISLFIIFAGQAEFQTFLATTFWLLLSFLFTIICKIWQECPINSEVRGAILQIHGQEQGKE